MLNPPLFSVRMRASRGGPHEQGGRHLSGAERLATPDELERVALELLRRGRGSGPDHLRITVDRVFLDPSHVASCLPLTTVDLADVDAAWSWASDRLLRAGVSQHAIDIGFRALREGADGDSRALAGALVLNATTGGRMIAERPHGVRASRFDYSAEVRAQVQEALAATGLGHYRTFEALALATKVIWSGVTAELCWSDDPDYTAGYVATAADGYVRFPHFKPAGATGGRIFYITADLDLPELIAQLTLTPLLISTVPTIIRRQVVSRTTSSTTDPIGTLNPHA